MTLGALIGAGALNRANTVYNKLLYYADFLNLIFMNINVKLDKNRRTIEVVYLQNYSFLSCLLS